MRKLVYLFTALLISQFSFGQSVQDNATIPVSVTLNSILRLTVTTGGNIQFVFNTMDQYNNGIANTPNTTTTFSVSSSRDFDITMGAEDASLFGVEDVAHTLALSVIQYTMGASGGGTKIAGLNPLLQNTGPATIVSHTAGTGAARTYDIEWEAGTVTSVLNSPADVYVTNVFLNLQPQ